VRLPFTLRDPPVQANFDKIAAVATGETTAVGRVDLAANGNINWRAGASGEADYTALSGIVFVAA
jgi:hypothetical protein